MPSVHQCVICKAGFVRNQYDICSTCGSIECDNCKKKVTSGMWVEYQEFWCFDCISKHGHRGPALPRNRTYDQKIKNDSKAFFKRIKEGGKLLTLRHTSCMGCNLKFIPLPHTDEQNFCGACLVHMRNHVCTSCFNPWDPAVGCDERGRCINCSTGSDYGIRTSYSSKSTRFSRPELCPNCNKEWCSSKQVLCQTCLDLLPY